MIRNVAVFERDLPAGFDGVFMWDFLRGAFGPSIEPMDFDGVVERFGHFLVFETKTPGTLVPRGQQLTLEQAARSRRFTIVFCAKRPEDVRGWDVLTHHGLTHHDGNANALKAWCALWYEHVNGLAR